MSLVSAKSGRILRFPNPSISVILFCLFFSIYALTIYGELRYGDESQRYFEAQSLVERQTFAIKLIPANTQAGVDGQNYSQFEIGMSLGLIPPYILGKAIDSFVPTADRDRIPILIVNLFNPFVTALACVVFFLFSNTLGVGRRTSILMTLGFGLGTIVWPYSKGLYREDLQAFVLLVSVYAIYRFRQNGSMKWFWLSATSLGYLTFVKLANAIMLPFFLAYLLVVLWERTSPADAAPARKLAALIGKLCLFALPAVVFLSTQGLVNASKWGSFFEVGPFNYTPAYFSFSNAPSAVANFLFSKERSIFIYAPPVILFLPAWVAFFRKDRIGAIFLLSLTAATILLVGTWSSSLDQSYWGPKYLVEFVPLMILPLGLLWEFAEGGKQRFWRFLIAVVFLIGFFVQVIAALSNDREYLDVNDRMLDPSGAFDFVRHGAIDSLAFSLSPRDGLLHINAYGWLTCALIVLFGSALILRWREHKSEGEREKWRGFATSTVAVSLQVSGLIALIAVPYANVLSEKGDTKYIAANNFLFENRFCEARGMYKTALALGTAYPLQIASRLETISPPAQGTEINIGNLTDHVPDANVAQVEEDTGFLLSEHSLRFTAPSEIEQYIETTTEFFPIQPNTEYELSGWLKADGVYGSGYALIGWYEDNGAWRKGRSIEVAVAKGPRGLQSARQFITTLPTTKRAFVKAGFWQAYGTLRVEGLRLLHVQSPHPDQFQPPCVN